MALLSRATLDETCVHHPRQTPRPFPRLWVSPTPLQWACITPNALRSGSHFLLYRHYWHRALLTMPQETKSKSSYLIFQDVSSADKTKQAHLPSRLFQTPTTCTGPKEEHTCGSGQGQQRWLTLLPTEGRLGRKEQDRKGIVKGATLHTEGGEGEEHR